MGKPDIAAICHKVKLSSFFRLYLALAVLIRSICMATHILHLTYADDIDIFIYVIVELLFYVSSGFVTTHTFSMMFCIAKKVMESHQSTFYCILSSLELFGKLFVECIAGSMVHVFGYFIFVTFCVVFDLLLVVAWTFRFVSNVKRKIVKSS